MRELLLLVDKKNGEYEKYENELEKLYERDNFEEEPDEEIEAETPAVVRINVNVISVCALSFKMLLMILQQHQEKRNQL